MSLVSVIHCNIRNYGSFGKTGILQNFMGWKRGKILHKKSDRPKDLNIFILLLICSIMTRLRASRLLYAFSFLVG
jgi:hypothetical protein